MRWIRWVLLLALTQASLGAVEPEEMVQALQLEGAEASALQQAFTASEQAVADWKASEKGTRLVELDTQIKQATKDRDLGRVRSTIAEAKPLRNELRALIASGQQGILDQFNAEQLAAWKAHRISQHYLELAGEEVNLSPEQQATIQQAAAEVIATHPDDALPGQYLHLEKAADPHLTEPQRATFEKIKDKNKMRSLRVSLF